MSLRVFPSRARTAALALSLAVPILGAACGGSGTPSSSHPPAAHVPTPRSAPAFPEAGFLLRTTVAVRSAPSPDAPVIRVLRQFRPDSRPTVVFAIDGTRNRAWLHIELPSRSNTLRGWIARSATQLHVVQMRIVVDRSARTLRLYDGTRRRFRTTVAVGRKGMETPLGHFYVRARYHATEHALGAYAFETSAYSKLSDWPGGGIIGIHGTPEPWLLGRAVSHGCVRVSNAAARRLEQLVPVGTAVFIHA